MGRTWWPFLIGTMMGCSPRVTVEGESSGSTTADGPTQTSGVAESTTGAGVTSPGPSGPNPTGPNPTSPVTSATAVGTTTAVGVDTGDAVTGDVDTGIADTGEADTGLVFDLPPMPVEGCIPPELHGPAIETHPGGWTAFEACEPDALILQTVGAPALITGEDVEAVFQTYGQALFGMPGAVATGIAPCCAGQRGSCLSVDVQAAELQINESLAYASELFVALSPECVGVRFQLVD